MKQTRHACHICGEPLFRLDSLKGFACPECDLIDQEEDDE